MSEINIKINDQIQVGQIASHWNVSHTRILKYSLEMYHKGMKEHKLMSAPDLAILENKSNLQAQKWMEKWREIESKRQLSAQREANIEEASARTTEAIKAIEAIDNLLIRTLSIDDTVNWDSMKKNNSFPEKPPAQPNKKDKHQYPVAPGKISPEFTFLDKLFRSRRESKLEECEKKNTANLADWENKKKEIDKSNAQLEIDFENDKLKWKQAFAEWKKRKDTFSRAQEEFNIKIDRMRESYLKQDMDSIIEYCDMVLNNSAYPESFPKSFELEYNPENKILIATKLRYLV